jgi:hypothetical protein
MSVTRRDAETSWKGSAVENEVNACREALAATPMNFGSEWDLPI